MKVRKFFVGADPHVILKHGKIGGVDLITNNAVVKFLEDEQNSDGGWAGYISLGDVYDMNVISSFSKTNLRGVQGEDVAGQYKAGNAYLTQHYKAAGKPKEFYLVSGNHEDRVDRYIAANPELDGIMNLHLHVPKFVKLIPFWAEHKVLTIGKASFIHGIGTSNRQVQNALRDYGTSIFMGHSHRRELASLRFHGNDSTKVAESLPCLCDYQQPYLKGKPTAWSQGYGVFYFWPDGRFNYYVTSIFDHAFISHRGKYYDGKNQEPKTKIIL